MKKYLSIFIDESGDFGEFNSIAPYYLVTMLFHNQSSNIAKEIAHLDSSLVMKGYPNHYLHTGPLIRKEELYKDLSIDERKSILNSFMAFAAKIDFKYKTFLVEKKKGDDRLSSQLSEQIKAFLNKRYPKISEYDKVMVYYDYGQKQITNIITPLFNDSKIEFKQNVLPANYRLFQIADLLTTFELINKKRENDNNSKSEKDFFGSMSKFNKDYYKRLSNRKID